MGTRNVPVGGFHSVCHVLPHVGLHEDRRNSGRDVCLVVSAQCGFEIRACSFRWEYPAHVARHQFDGPHLLIVVSFLGGVCRFRRRSPFFGCDKICLWIAFVGGVWLLIQSASQVLTVNVLGRFVVPRPLHLSAFPVGSRNWFTPASVTMTGDIVSCRMRFFRLSARFAVELDGFLFGC